MIFENILLTYWRRAAGVRSYSLVLGNLVVFVWLVSGTVTENSWIRLAAIWLDVEPTATPADAIVVLGGSSDRLLVGGNLYREGFASELWYTGARAEVLANPAQRTELLQTTATRAGVPVEALTLLPTTSTWEDGEQVAATVRARQSRSILVVTSWFHGRRALCAIRHHLADDTVRIYYHPVPTSGFGVQDWWTTSRGYQTVTRELLKSLYYWQQYDLIPWVC